MPRKSSSKKASKKGGRPPLTMNDLARRSKQRAGMPALASITGVKPLGVTPTGAAAGLAGVSKYSVIKTVEVDAYEKVAVPGAVISAAAAAAAAPTGDNFKGKARKAAKLSIGKKKTEEFMDLKQLIDSLPTKKEMVNHDPPINTSQTSGRVEEEQRNVRLRVFLYAASREDDNDFHLILGRAPNKAPELYMTMELSGLPPSGSASFKKLNATRNAYKKFFGADLPGLSYDFYDPPIPVEIEGSLFFDMTHATGQKPGPKSLKSRMPTIWEVHPITKIKFEP